MSGQFDIGPSGDLAIFTNNDDMFNISTDIGPNFILDQGHDRGIANIGSTQNVTMDVIADMPNEAPIDFINYSNNQAKIVADCSVGQRMPRQKLPSTSSNATIEAEPEPIKKKKSHSQSHSQNLSPPQGGSQKVLTQSSSSMPPPFGGFGGNGDNSKEADTPPNIGLNLGFDDLLDNRKLKPVSDIIDEAASIGGDSQTTIKYGGYDISEPNSPGGFRPIANSPVPDSPLPTTFKEDRGKRKTEGRGQSQNYQSSQSQPQNYFQETSAPPTYDDPPKYMNEDDEKMDLLLKLKSLEERGKITLSKHYNIKSSIDDIRMEYRNQTGILELQTSLKFMRKGLIFCTSGLEYINHRFDPVGAKLDGWGESIMENIMDYDTVFERLHGKYKGSMEMEPEMELLFALAGSAFQFHLSQTFFKSAIPQLGQVLRENPDVIKGFMNVAQEAARRNTGGQGGMMQGGPIPANEVGVGPSSGGGYNGGMQSPGIDFGSLLGQVGITSGVLSDFAKTMGNVPPPPQTTRDYREPPVNDLYRQMMQQQHQQNQQDETLSVSSETSERSLGRRGGTKAVITPMPTNKRGGGGNVIRLT